MWTAFPLVVWRAASGTIPVQNIMKRDKI